MNTKTQNGKIYHSMGEIVSEEIQSILSRLEHLDLHIYWKSSHYLNTIKERQITIF